MTNSTRNTNTTRCPDCVTEIRMGNTILTVSGYFKQGTTVTAADKMMKVLETEAMSKPGTIAWNLPQSVTMLVTKYAEFHII